MRIRAKIISFVVGLSAMCVLTLSATHKPFPTDEALQARFLANRVDFQRLVTMTNEDSHLTRIAPDFTWLDDDVSWPRKNVGISEQRWNEYRQVFRTVGTSNGIIRYANPTLIKFPIVSLGLVPSGAVKGLAYSEAPLSPVLESLERRLPNKLWDGPDHTHVLVYKQIEDHWYIYYEEW